MEIKKDTIIMAFIIFLLALSVFQTTQINSLKNRIDKITANAIANGGGNTDMSGWTEDEKMMYEHHGTLPSRLQNNLQNQDVPSMVGGC